MSYEVGRNIADLYSPEPAYDPSQDYGFAYTPSPDTEYDYDGGGASVSQDVPVYYDPSEDYGFAYARDPSYEVNADAIDDYIQSAEDARQTAAIMGVGGALLGLPGMGLGGLSVQNVANKLSQGVGVPYTYANDPNRIAGVMHPGFFGGTVRSGMPADPHAEYMREVMANQNEERYPYQAMPTAYAQAPSVLDQPAASTSADPYPLYRPVAADAPAYARMGLLDQAPTGLLEFAQRYNIPATDFAAANRAFRQQGAYRPAYYSNPRPTQGYTLLG